MALDPELIEFIDNYIRERFRKHGSLHEFGQDDYVPLLTVEEADGSPSIRGVYKLIVSAGDLTNPGDGTALLATGGGGGGAPVGADYLVGTAQGGLSAEIVVGTSPGGELGGTWASPTVDATHSGSAHHTQSHDHASAGDGTTLQPTILKVANDTELTIATGAITVTQTHHTIDTQSDDATDDLDTINGLAANTLYVFWPASDARSIVLKHETGNIHIAHANADLTLENSEDWVWGFSPDGANIYILGGGGGGGAVAHDDVDTTGMKRQLTLLAASALPTVTDTPGLSAQRFETSTNDIIYMALPWGSSTAANWAWNFPAPLDWDLGTVTFQVHWTPADSSGDVVFQMRGLAVSEGDALDGADYGSYATVTDTLTTALDLHVTADSGALTIAGTPALGDHLFLQLLHDPAHGSDTFAGSGRILAVVIKYGVTSLGV